MDGNDFIQSIFTGERHRQFDREVEKDRLAKLASPRVHRSRFRMVALFAWTSARLGTRRGVQRRAQRAPTSIP
jgi:hypothetical protein